MKRFVSLFLVTLMAGVTFGLASAAPENAGTNAPYISGYDDGTFRPNDKITRAEAVKMLVEATGISQSSERLESLSDVSDGKHWATPYIGGAKSAGIVDGEDGNFHPEREITRAELSAMISRSYRDSINEIAAPARTFSDIDGHWAKAHIIRMTKLGVASGYDDETFRPEQGVTRAEAAKMINARLGKKLDESVVSKLENKFSDVSKDMWSYNDIMAASSN